VRCSEFDENYAICEKVGEGAFGQVHVVKRRDSNELHAVKIVKDGDAEARVWKKLKRYEHCVELLDHFVDEDFHYLVMELCAECLLERLEKVPCMSGLDLVKILREMLLSIAHLHKARIVHRDIKPDNFLCSAPSGGIVKLCDFGSAVELPKDGILHWPTGTAPYMSPEMIAGTGYSSKTDVWSLGVSAYMILYGSFPYEPTKVSAEAMKKAILSGVPAPTYLPVGEHWAPNEEPPARAVNFVRSLLQRSEAERCNSSRALTNSLFTVSPATDDITSRILRLEPCIQQALKRCLEYKPRVNDSFRRSWHAPVSRKPSLVSSCSQAGEVEPLRQRESRLQKRWSTSLLDNPKMASLLRRQGTRYRHPG